MPLRPFAYISLDHGAKNKRLTEMSTIGRLNHLTERMGLVLPCKDHNMASSESRMQRHNETMSTIVALRMGINIPPQSGMGAPPKNHTGQERFRQCLLAREIRREFRTLNREICKKDCSGR